MPASSVKSLLQNKTSYKVTGSLWIECNGERFFGPGRVELLQRIEETGSINKAAKSMGMSYKKAWEMINALNSQASSAKKTAGHVVPALNNDFAIMCSCSAAQLL